MRSALKDTAQRNKSLTGFVKCSSCVKFAFSECNACGREGIYFISHRAERDISQCSTEHYFTFCKAKYFTICICDHKCSASYALIKDYKTSDKSNAKALMASDFHKCFLLPSEKCSSPRVILSGGRRIRRPQSNP